MRRYPRLTAAFLAAMPFAASPAWAAAPADGESLSGIYIGVHAGYGTGSKDWQGTANPNPVPPLGSANLADHSANGLLVGGTIGASFETGGFVLGLEGELSWADFDDSSPSTAFAGSTNSTEVSWTGSLTGQIGFNPGGLHPYLEAGIGFARDRYTVVDGDGVAPNRSGSVAETRTGVVFGGGVAFPLGGGWSARGEYNYGNFGSRDYAIGGDVWTIDQTTHSFRFALLYRFGR